MTKPSKATTHQSKRARRAADRRAAATSPSASSAPTRSRSPILLITAIVGGIGVVVLGALILFQGGPQGATGTTGLVRPASPTSVALADGRALGKADAPVTLEVWTDFQCPVCGQFARTVEPALVSKYVTPGTLRIVHHDAAFQGARSSSSYDESVEAAAGGRCAADQGGYWPYQDWVFANQDGENRGAFAASRLTSIASASGLDLTAWKACVATGTHQAAARSETAQALAAGVDATPTMQLNGQTIVGLRSVTELGGLIEAAAAAVGSGG